MSSPPSSEPTSKKNPHSSANAPQNASATLTLPLAAAAATAPPSSLSQSQPWRSTMGPPDPEFDPSSEKPDVRLHHELLQQHQQQHQQQQRQWATGDVQLLQKQAGGIAAGAKGFGETAELEENREDGLSRSSSSSDFSSIPSLGRQMTELTEIHCLEVMDQQCNNFQNRSTEYWSRQSTVPARRQNNDCLEGLRRQLSCPEPSPIQMPRMVQFLDRVPDEGSQFGTPAGSRQVSSMSQNPEDAVDFGLLEAAVTLVVSECDFSVTVADPLSLDSDLIAVSPGFEAMSGYNRNEVIGENCRFLSEGCPMDQSVRSKMKEASDTGVPFVQVLVNRKKSGEPFLNLLDMRGLVIATNLKTDEEIWISVGVQMDITGKDPSTVPQDHAALMKQLGNRIGKRMLKSLSELGLGGSVGQFRMKRNGAKSQAGTWLLMTDARWKAGKLDAESVKKSLQDLPDLSKMSFPHLVGLSRRVKTEDDLPLMSACEIVSGVCMGGEGSSAGNSPAVQISTAPAVLTHGGPSKARVQFPPATEAVEADASEESEASVDTAKAQTAPPSAAAAASQPQKNTVLAAMLLAAAAATAAIAATQLARRGRGR